MPKMKQSASDKHQYAQYKSRFEKNQLAKLFKLAKQQPNNKPLQAKLEKAMTKGIPYTRNRKSNGHKCKGLSKEFGFEKNQMSEGMKKSKLDLHWFYNPELTFKSTKPNHGSSMGDQLESLGYKRKKYVGKHKKAAR